MPNSLVLDQARAAGTDCWAEIRIGGQSIRYRRLGAGYPVLVLAEAAEICPTVADALTQGGALRLILPEPPLENVHLAGWLGDFLEGVGATSVGLLATQSFCMAAVELAMFASEQITRAVLVADEPGSFGRWCEGWQHGSLTSARRSGTVPILLVHKGQPLSEIGPLVRNFFDDK
jgi:hypothetical protein